MRKLPATKRAAILSALVEGSSINSTARMVGVSKITVLRLLADAGTFCAEFHNDAVRNVSAKDIQADELWSYCGCKERAKKRGAQGHGDAWVWVAMDRESKLVISYRVGKRTGDDAQLVMNDLARRVTGRPQVSTDALNSYAFAVSAAFKGQVDHATIHKTYAETKVGPGRYSPPVCTGCTKASQSGTPDLEKASTSHVERQNLTVRMSSRRFARLTNGFSKRIENHEHAVALHYWFFNFARKHATLKTTPAGAAGIADKALTMLDLVNMIEKAEGEKGGRLTSYLPAATPN
jgi:IS1 family transposase